MSTFRKRFAATFAVVALLFTGLAVTSATATADTTRGADTARVAVAAKHTAKRIPARFKNCTKLQKRWPHGVGRKHARDKTSGTPVTTFKRSNKLYKKAMRYNRDLDRDKDKIACEKR
jgi:hypothetical protein